MNVNMEFTPYSDNEGTMEYRVENEVPALLDNGNMDLEDKDSELSNTRKVEQQQGPFPANFPISLENQDQGRTNQMPVPPNFPVLLDNQTLIPRMRYPSNFSMHHHKNESLIQAFPVNVPVPVLRVKLRRVVTKYVNCGNSHGAKKNNPASFSRIPRKGDRRIHRSLQDEAVQKVLKILYLHNSITRRTVQQQKAATEAEASGVPVAEASGVPAAEASGAPAAEASGAPPVSTERLKKLLKLVIKTLRALNQSDPHSVRESQEALDRLKRHGFTREYKLLQMLHNARLAHQSRNSVNDEISKMLEQIHL